MTQPQNHSVAFPPREPVTIRTLRKMAERGEAFSCLTCYDATTARWLERAGLHVLLVGDTAAEVIFGYSRTIDCPLDSLIELTAAVKRGAPNTFVMGDMPFMSYQTDDATAIANAGRFLTQGKADIVKLEVDASFAPLIAKMARAGIPVCAHVGSRPQTAAMTGGYVGAGRTSESADRILADAHACEDAGAVMLLIEAVPHDLTTRLIAQTKLPVIGIGAGNSCHGQVLVLQDLLGLSDRPPVFARPVAEMGAALIQAGQEWVRLVRDRQVGIDPAKPAPASTPTTRKDTQGQPRA
ncbi:MAG: 3-methyl-2-oxobutanoate hydroxymethyltransferase [Planctomycetes bacterium]|nr:3-methyl-2-oxobutanoate hydroxymethyltransferase [Planctomycetota bacterium]